MPKAQRIVEIVNVEKLPGDWGSQITVAEARMLRKPSGLHFRFPVFRSEDGDVTLGMPLVPGAAPGARYSSIWFDTDAKRAHFLAAFRSELKNRCPELFGSEGQS